MWQCQTCETYQKNVKFSMPPARGCPTRVNKWKKFNFALKTISDWMLMSIRITGCNSLLFRTSRLVRRYPVCYWRFFFNYSILKYRNTWSFTQSLYLANKIVHHDTKLPFTSQKSTFSELLSLFLTQYFFIFLTQYFMHKKTSFETIGVNTKYHECTHSSCAPVTKNCEKSTFLQC